MGEIVHPKSIIGALYIEDVFEFFMKSYMIAWQRSYGVSESLDWVPRLFTQEIGRTAFNISETYQYRQKVGVSELREYFNLKSMFYKHVHSKALECLQRPEETSFFHMSAYAGEVAVFCHFENVSYLHQTLISAILDLLNEYGSLHLETTRLYYQNLAKELDEARIKRVSSEVDATLTNQSFQSENPISNPEAFSAENSYNNHQYVTPSVVSEPFHAVDVKYNVSQLQSFVPLDAVNFLSGASFSHPSSYTSFIVPKTMTSGSTYQNLIGAQSIPVNSSNQQLPGYFPSPIVPSVMYPSTVESEFNASHVQQNFISSPANAPELVSSFNTVNDKLSTEHTTTKNSNGNVSTMGCPRSNSKFKALNVNAPVFVHSSEKPTVDSAKTEASKKSPKKDENPISSSNGTHAESN